MSGLWILISTEARIFHAGVTALLVSGAIAGCSRGSHENRLVLLSERPPITLDPRYGGDTASENTTWLLYNGLTRLNDQLDFVPDLAERIETPDSKTYIFHLRPGLKFHDGSPVRAEDVVWSYRFLADEKNGTLFRSVFKYLDRVEIIDPLTIKFTLNEPYAFFLNAVRRPILPEKIAGPAGKEGFRKLAVGTGPFRLIRFEDRGGMELRAYHEFHGGAPKFTYLKIKPVQDLNVRTLELLKGSGDILQSTSDTFPPGAIQQLASEPNLSLVRRPSANVHYLNFNMRNPILKKLQVRKAFAHAIDRDSIIRHKFGGYAVPATGFLPPIHWAYERNVTTYSFDPAIAKKLLDEAGFRDPDGAGPKPRFTLNYLTSTNPQSREIVQVIVSELADIGIGINLRSIDFGVLFDDIKKGNFDLYSLQWTGIASPDDLYDIFHSTRTPPDGNNRNFYSNRKVDRLLDEGRVTIDREKQREIYGRVQKILAEEIPSFFLWYPEQIAVVRDRVTGYQPVPGGTYDALASVVLRPNSSE